MEFDIARAKGIPACLFPDKPDQDRRVLLRGPPETTACIVAAMEICRFHDSIFVIRAVLWLGEKYGIWKKVWSREKAAANVRHLRIDQKPISWPVIDPTFKRTIPLSRAEILHYCSATSETEMKNMSVDSSVRCNMTQFCMINESNDLFVSHVFHVAKQ